MALSTSAVPLATALTLLSLASLCQAGSSPLLLTPYLQQKRLDEAQTVSRVGKVNTSCPLWGHSAFLTVNANHGTNLFFWFLPAESHPESAPLLLWLDGGPGTTSMTGAFLLTGPCSVDAKDHLSWRPQRWTRRYNMLYVDNPAGVGFSFTGDEAGYARSEDDVARDLYAFLVQFVQIFYQYRSSPLYLGGLSYAGKYVPALGYHIHTQNPAAAVRLNLQGIYIGGPFTDPKTILPTYATHLYNTGLLSWLQSQQMEAGMAKAVDLMAKGDYQGAYDRFQDYYLGTGFLYKSSGFQAHVNILQVKMPSSDNSFDSFVTAPQVRAAMHTGDVVFNASSSKVFGLLEPDFLQSVLPQLASLMDHYRVLLFNGQLDMIVCPPSTQATLRSAVWSGRQEYLAAPRHVWRLRAGDAADVAGWVTAVRNFTHVVIREAGHMTPLDQPLRTWDMIQRFVDGRPFF